MSCRFDLSPEWSSPASVSRRVRSDGRQNDVDDHFRHVLKHRVVQQRRQRRRRRRCHRHRRRHGRRQHRLHLFQQRFVERIFLHFGRSGSGPGSGSTGISENRIFVQRLKRNFGLGEIWAGIGFGFEIRIAWQTKRPISNIGSFEKGNFWLL